MLGRWRYGLNLKPIPYLFMQYFEWVFFYIYANRWNCIQAWWSMILNFCIFTLVFFLIIWAFKSRTVQHEYWVYHTVHIRMYIQKSTCYTHVLYNFNKCLNFLYLFIDWSGAFEYEIFITKYYNYITETFL